MRFREIEELLSYETLKIQLMEIIAGEYYKCSSFYGILPEEIIICKCFHVAVVLFFFFFAMVLFFKKPHLLHAVGICRCTYSMIMIIDSEWAYQSFCFKIQDYKIFMYLCVCGIYICVWFGNILQSMEYLLPKSRDLVSCLRPYKLWTV